jgi:hypothetical protein
MTMQELIERLEKCGVDREIDAAIAVSTTATVSTADDLIYAAARARDGSDATHPGNYFIKSRSGMSCRSAPHYTSSIDAALTLVPEDRDVILKIYGPGENVAFCPFKDGSFSKTFSKAATPALALCIAALRARLALASDGEKE